MAKTIGIIIDFLTNDYRRQIDASAAKYGYATRYYASSAEAVGKVDDCEILYGHCSGKVIASAPNLKWFACCWAGVDSMCRDELYHDPNCILTNSSGAYGTTIAEHLIMIALMLLRRQVEYSELMRQRLWQMLSPIQSLYDCRVSVLGTGDIGTEFARRLSAFHPACVRGIRRSSKPCDSAFTSAHTIAELDSLLPKTDLLVMCVPSTPETVGILSRERIALLPDGAYVINVGRGTAVDQDALCDALNCGHLAGAALDVVVPEPLPADHPLRDTKNLLLTPHVAGNTTLGHTCDLNVAMFCENLDNYCSGRPLKHVVDRTRGY